MKFRIVVVRFVERNSLARTAHIPVICKLESKTTGDSRWTHFAHGFVCIYLVSM